MFSSVFLASGVAGNILLNNTRAEHMVALSGVEAGLAVVEKKDPSTVGSQQILIFDHQTTRTGGEPAAIIKPAIINPHQVECSEILGLLALEDGSLAVSTGPIDQWVSCGSTGSSVQIYGAQTLMSGGDPDVVLSGLPVSGINVMTELSNGQFVFGSSIFDKEALMQGGNSTVVLDTKYAYWDAVSPFQGGLSYTSSGENSLLIYDDAAISGEDLRPSLEIGGAVGKDWDPNPAKWGIPAGTGFCSGTSLAFEDGALAVLGTCHQASNAVLTIFENIDFDARTMRNTTFSMPQFAQMMPLSDGRIAVAFETLPCLEGQIQVFEESALRGGGEPSVVLHTNGSVISMSAFQDGRLAISMGGGGAGYGCNTYTVDIVDVNANTDESTFQVI